VERRIPKHATRLSAAHEAALDAGFHVGQRVRTIDGLIGRVIMITESFSPGNTEYQVILDSGMGGGTYLGSQLRPVGEDYGGGHQRDPYLPAGVTAALEAEADLEAHAAHDDYPEMGSVLFDRPDPGAQISVLGKTAAVQGHGLDPFAMAMHGLSGDDAEYMRAVIEHIRQRKGQGVPIDSGDAELMARSMRGRDRMEQAGYQLSAHSRDMKFPRGFAVDVHHNHRVHLVPERDGGETSWYARIVHAPHLMAPKIEHTIRTSDEDLPAAVGAFLDHPDTQAEMTHQREEGRRIHGEIRAEGHLMDWDAEDDDPEDHNATWCHVCGEHHDDPEEADQHDSAHTDWDEVYPHLGPEIHRGISVDLPPGLHRDVHDPSIPAGERAHMLSGHLRGRPIGNSWSTDPGKADHYTMVSGHYGGGGQTHVMFHAATPAREHIETDPYTLEGRNVLGYDKHEDKEVPLRDGTPLQVHGISWRLAEPGAGYTHPARGWEVHRFEHPHQHLAAMYADGFDPRDQDYNGEPEVGGIYWSAPAQQAFVDDELGQPVPGPVEMVGPEEPGGEEPEPEEDGEEPGPLQSIPAEAARQMQVQRRPQRRRDEGLYEQPWPPPVPLRRPPRRRGEPEEPDEEEDEESLEAEARRYVATTINGQPVDGTGDAPGHGTRPRAADPEGYDEESTETEGDPRWSDPVDVAEKREFNGAMIGMYPEGVSAGGGPGISVAAASASDDDRWYQAYNNAAERLFGKKEGDTLSQEEDEAAQREADEEIRAEGSKQVTAAGLFPWNTPEGQKHMVFHMMHRHKYTLKRSQEAGGDIWDAHRALHEQGGQSHDHDWPLEDRFQPMQPVHKKLPAFRPEQGGAAENPRPTPTGLWKGGEIPEGHPLHPHWEDFQPRHQSDNPRAVLSGLHAASLRDDKSDRWHEYNQAYRPDTLHRGIHIQLPGDLHEYVHDDSQPREDRARALAQHFADRGGLGQHWTPHTQIAHRAIWNAADAGHGLSGGQLYRGEWDGPTTDIMFHVQRPGRRNEIRDPKQLEQHDVGWAYSKDEDETFLKHGSPLKLEGISWKPHEPDYPNEPFEHHDFARPMRHVARVPWTPEQRTLLHSWQEEPTATTGDFVPSTQFTNKAPEPVPEPDPEMQFAEAVGPRAFTEMTARLAAHAPHSRAGDLVYSQLSKNYPAGAIGWVHDAQWEGPHHVPLDQVDFSGRDGWQASKDPDEVGRKRKKIEKREKNGEHPKPALLVSRPGGGGQLIADGHHRALAEEQLAGEDEGRPGLWAWTGHVDEDEGPWDTMHQHQGQDEYFPPPGASDELEAPGAEPGMNPPPGGQVVPGPEGSGGPSAPAPGSGAGNGFFENPTPGLPPLSQGGTPGPRTKNMTPVEQSPAFQLAHPELQQQQQQQQEPPPGGEDEDEGGDGGPPPGGKQARRWALAAFEEAAGNPGFRLQFTSSWHDVVAKAHRILNDGGVRITMLARSLTAGEVKGDHATYETGLQYYPGRGFSVMAYSCGCPWASFHQDPDYPSRFAGRMCSHAYALSLAAKQRGVVQRTMFPDLAGWPEEVVVKSWPPFDEQGKQWSVTYKAPMTGRPVMGSLGAQPEPPAVTAARVLLGAGEDPAAVAVLMACAGLHEAAGGLHRTPHGPISWDEIGERYPGLYGDPEVHGEAAEGADGEGVGWAANHLANDRPDDPDAENSGSWDLAFHHERVDPANIDYARHGRHDPRVRHAMEGYVHGRPHSVPPLILVHRHGVYQVADGHHRAEGGFHAGTKVDAFVHYSEHPDEPFSASEDRDQDRAPFHQASPHPGVAAHRDFFKRASLSLTADQANAPWGSQTVTEAPPAKPYGGTSPPEKDTDPGSYGPLTGPDPDNWGEISDSSITQTPTMTNEAARASEDDNVLDTPATNDWAGEGQSLSYQDPGANFIDTPGRAGPARTAGTARQETGPVMDTALDTDTGPVTREWQESFPYPAQGGAAGPSTAISPRDPGGIRMEEALLAARRAFTAAMNATAGPDDQEHPAQLTDIVTNETADAQDVPHKFAEKGDHTCRTCGLSPAAVVHGRDTGQHDELAGHKTAAGLREDAVWATQQRDAMDPEFRSRGHDMAWERGEGWNRKGRAQYWEGTCRHCGAGATVGSSWSSSHTGKDARHETCSGPGTGWQNEMVEELRHQRFQEAVSQFGQEVKDEHDRAWLRGQGIEASRAELKDEPEAALDPEGLTAEENPENPPGSAWGNRLPGTYTQASGSYNPDADPSRQHAVQVEEGISGRAQHPDQFLGQQPGMGSLDEPSVPGDSSVQTVGSLPASPRRAHPCYSMPSQDPPGHEQFTVQGQQQWSGGDYNSGDLATSAQGQENPVEGEDADIVRQFQASAAARQYSGDGATRVDADIAGAAREYLAKTADVLPPEEADELIREGRGTRARNLDLLDLDGTHYQDHPGLDDRDDDVLYA
jgi:hypothetical protein